MFKIPTILAIVTSMGGGVYYGDSGGYGGGGNYGASPGALSGVTSFLNSLPTPVATIIICAAVILIATLVGKIIATVFANIFYPDPEKPSIFTKQQKLMFLGGSCVAFAVIIFSLTYTPKQMGNAVNVDNFGENGYVENGGMDGNFTNDDGYDDSENYPEGMEGEIGENEDLNPPAGGTESSAAANPLLRGVG